MACGNIVRITASVTGLDASAPVAISALLFRFSTSIELRMSSPLFRLVHALNGTVESPVRADDDLLKPKKLEGNEGRLAESVVCISAKSTSKEGDRTYHSCLVDGFM